MAGAMLKKVNLSHNKLTQIPAEMFEQCVMIESLILAKNQLDSLPRSLGNLSKLSELDLSGNRFLDSFLQTNEGAIELSLSLKVLNLAQNQLTKVPGFAYRVDTVDLSQNKLSDWNADSFMDFS